MNKEFSFSQRFYNCGQTSLKEKRLDDCYTSILAENKNKGVFDLTRRKQKYLDVTYDVVNELKSRYQKLVVFGMGGSSLGAKSLCFYKNLEGNQDKKIHFIDNIHCGELIRFLDSINFSDTAFLIISKSGKTLEIISQVLVLIEHYKKQLSECSYKNLYFITGDSSKSNLLYAIANHCKRKIIELDEDIGGRYSCFTPVSLIPALFCGFDIVQYMNGAEKVMQSFLSGSAKEVKSGVKFLDECTKNHLLIQVMMPYLGKLYHFNYWYSQLVSESLGKNGFGFTLLKAMGSIDQHSVLQLFLDGPKDKFFSFITANHQLGDKIVVPDYLANDLSYLSERKLSDVINANQEATIGTVIKKNIPIRRFHFEKIDEGALGEMMMYYILETIFFAKTLGINPFDQPAVEKGKKIARKILSNTNKVN